MTALYAFPCQGRCWQYCPSRLIPTLYDTAHGISQLIVLLPDTRCTCDENLAKLRGIPCGDADAARLSRSLTRFTKDSRTWILRGWIRLSRRCPSCCTHTKLLLGTLVLPRTQNAPLLFRLPWPLLLPADYAHEAVRLRRAYGRLEDGVCVGVVARAC